jgi:tetratricopeptide (TPR) repeat protein
MGFGALIMLMIAVVVSSAWAQGAGRRQVAEGNKLYAEGQFDQANNKYRDAEVSNPESPIVHFNIGDALYKKRKYEEALETYRKAAQKSDDALLQAQSYYNMGNTLFRLNKWPESLLAYQQALKLNPNDKDAKYNLEYVRAKIKENARKQPQDHQQQQQDQQQNSEQQDQQDQQKQDQQQEQQNQQQSEQQQQEQSREGGTQQKTDKEQLSKEDAARLLEALKNQEKEAQKQRQMKVRGSARVEKDW